MAGAAYGKNIKRASHQLDGAAADPDADDEEEQAYGHRANLALRHDEPQTECQVTRGAKHQQARQGDVEGHNFLAEINRMKVMVSP